MNNSLGRRRLLVFALLALAHPTVRADLVEEGVRDSPPSGLLAGVARANITPPVGIAQMNWGSQSHVVSIGNDPIGMHATALVLSDGDQKFAMVDIDRLFVNDLEPAIERAAASLGIPARHIRLAATHTHAGVNVSAAKGPAGFDLSALQAAVERYNDYLVDQIVGILVKANANLQPAHAFGAHGIGSININRRVRAAGNNPPAVGRNPEGFVDRDLVVIRIDDAQGAPLAVIANYACHGTVLAYENKLISPDWVGNLRATVEQAMPSAKCLFFQGAAGNQGPIEGFSGDLAVAHRLGATLGHAAAAVAHGIETVDRQPTFEGFVESTAYQAKQHWRVKGPRKSRLRQASAIVALPRRQYTPREIAGMAARLDDARKKAAASRDSGDAWQVHQAEARVRRFSDLLENWQRPVESTPIRVQVEVLRVGDMAIVSMPGEPFAEIGVAVKEASPFPVTMFCGYSDGVGGDYLPTSSEFQHGGYEVERTPYGIGADKQLIAAAVGLLEQVK